MNAKRIMGRATAFLAGFALASGAAIALADGPSQPEALPHPPGLLALYVCARASDSIGASSYAWWAVDRAAFRWTQESCGLIVGYCADGGTNSSCTNAFSRVTGRQMACDAAMDGKAVARMTIGALLPVCGSGSPR